MLEGLPPNNAAYRLSLVTDEKRARAVADLIVESFELAEVASTAFETEEFWPGDGRAWLVEAYFGFEPDEEEIRALIAAASDEETARSATFGLTEKRDWVANALAGLRPVALQETVEMQKAPPCAAVMAGAEGEASLNFDPDVVG